MDEKLSDVTHAAEVRQWPEPISQMKIIDQKNETIGNFTISQDELATILANKNDGGVITVHIQSADGTLNPVQLQIVPEDQIANMYHQTEESVPKSCEGIKLVKDAVSIVNDKERGVTAVMQLSNGDFKSLINVDKGDKVKSLVFKQVDRGLTGNINCMTNDPTLRKYIKLRPYVDPTIESVVTKSTLPTNKPAKNFNCHACDQSFSFINNLKRHITNIHQKGNESKMNSCPYCSKTFSRKDYLNVHIKAVHQKANFTICLQCNKTFSQKSSLTRHVESVHYATKRFQCKFCDYCATNTNDVKKHAAVVHFKRSRYECMFCGFTSWHAYQLKLHLQKNHRVGEDNFEPGKKCSEQSEKKIGNSSGGNRKNTGKPKKSSNKQSAKNRLSDKKDVKEDPVDMVPWYELAIKEEPED